MESSAPTAVSTRTPLRLLVGLFLVTSSLLAIQVALTRIYSVILWYHFASLAISLTLLGFAISGVTHYLWGWLRERDPTRLMGLSALLFSLTTTLCILVITFTVLENTYLRVLLCMIMVIPFFFAGLCISVVIYTWSSDISRVYFADLLGSSLGCVCVVAALSLLGGRDTVLASAALAAIGSAVLIGKRERFVAVSFGAALIALLAMAFPDTQTSRFGVVSHRLNLNPDNYITSKWNSFSRVDFYHDRSPNFARGLVLKLDEDKPVPERILMAIDGWAQTDLVEFEGRSFEDLRFIDNTLMALTFSTSSPRDRVLAIGAGGGLDVLTALYFGATEVTAVEINSVITDAVLEDYRQKSGDLYRQPEVELVVADGRHYLERTDKQFDMILLSGVDTQAATEMGAFALAENYLYTVEAFEAYLDRLSENGVLAFRRWLFTPPRQTLRLVAMAVQVLEERYNIDQPMRHIVVLGSGRNSLTLIKKTPFNKGEIAALIDNSAGLPVEVLYTPDFEEENEFVRFMRTGDRAGFIQAYPFDITPSTDNSPFFFEHLRWSQAHTIRYEAIKQHSGQFLLLVSLLGLFVLLAVFVLLPLLLSRRRRHISFRRSWRLLAYFYAIGLAFIMVEISLMQKFILFLGLPTYSLSVVLFSLLALSAVGSQLTARWMQQDLRRAVGLSVTALLLVGLLYTDTVFSIVWGFVRYGTPVRILVTVLALAPLAILMGMPFPLGIRTAAMVDRNVVPWLWAMNGHATVLGALGAVVLAIMIGFKALMLTALAIYLLGALLLISRPFEDYGPYEMSSAPR